MIVRQGKKINMGGVILISVVVVLLAIVLYFVLSVVKDNRARSVLSSKVDSLRLDLDRAGIESDVSEYCYRPTEGFGEGPKRCYVSVVSLVKADDEASADSYMSGYSSVLSSQQWVKNDNVFPKQLPHMRNGIDFGAVGLRLKNTKTQCSVKYDFDLSKESLNITFACDTTPWLTKFFEG